MCNTHFSSVLFLSLSPFLTSIRAISITIIISYYYYYQCLILFKPFNCSCLNPWGLLFICLILPGKEGDTELTALWYLAADWVKPWQHAAQFPFILRFLMWFVVLVGFFALTFLLALIQLRTGTSTWPDVKQSWKVFMQDPEPVYHRVSSRMWCADSTCWCNGTELCSWQGSAVWPRAPFDLPAKWPEIRKESALLLE